MALSGFSVVLAEERLEQFTHTVCTPWVFGKSLPWNPADMLSFYCVDGAKCESVKSPRGPCSAGDLSGPRVQQTRHLTVFFYHWIYCMPPHTLSPSIYERQIALSKVIRANHGLLRFDMSMQCVFWWLNTVLGFQALLWLDWSAHYVYRLTSLWYLSSYIGEYVSGCFQQLFVVTHMQVYWAVDYWWFNFTDTTELRMGEWVSECSNWDV